MAGLPLAWAISCSTGSLYKLMLRYENWLLLHIIKRTTIGLHVRDIVFSDPHMGAIDRCPRCQHPSSPFVPLAVLRTFFGNDPQLANAFYEWFEEHGPERPPVVGRKLPHIMDVL